MAKKGQGANARPSTAVEDSKEPKMDIKSILKDIEFLRSSHMTWKQKKDLENKKVVSLGGKPPERQRLPLSVAQVAMKKQKKREEKMHEESAILRSFGVYTSSSSTKKAVERRRQRTECSRQLKDTSEMASLMSTSYYNALLLELMTTTSRMPSVKGRKRRVEKRARVKELVAVENDAKILRNCIIANLRNGEEIS